MEFIESFITHYRHFFALVNGLAFFTLSLSIILEGEGDNKPRLAGPVRTLAGYGFWAAMANWLRMFMLTQDSATSIISVLQITRLFCLIFAGVFLVRYATQTIIEQKPQIDWIHWLFPAVCIVFSIVFAFIVLDRIKPFGDWVSTADIAARYLLLLPGFILTAICFWKEWRNSTGMQVPHLAGDMLGASMAFTLKAVTSGVAAFPLFSSSDVLSPVATLALYFSRTAGTVAVAFFIVRLLRDFEIERNRQYNEEVNLRFEAQQETMATQNQMHSEIERWARQLEDLVDSIASAMSMATRLEEILDVSLAKVLELTRFDAGDILLIQEGDSNLQLIAQKGMLQLTQECQLVMQPSTTPLFEVLTSGEIVVVQDLFASPATLGSPCVNAGFRCLVNVLITCRGHLLGVMNLLGKTKCDPESHELRVLSAIGQQIGVAIENARLNLQTQNMAALEERERLSRELHDGLAQVLGYLHLKSYGISELLDAGQLSAAQSELHEMQEVARETQNDVREAILGLRTTISPDRGIIPTLTEYVNRFSQQSGITTKLIAGDATHIEFEPGVEIQLLRIVQEALTNTRKHSQADRACVKLETDGAVIVIKINDNGCGFDPETLIENGHYGVQTMRERAQSAGGDMELISQPGQGTKVIVKLPYKQWGK